jgi:hypothetical protein
MKQIKHKLDKRMHLLDDLLLEQNSDKRKRRKIAYGMCDTKVNRAMSIKWQLQLSTENDELSTKLETKTRRQKSMRLLVIHSRS